MDQNFNTKLLQFIQYYMLMLKYLFKVMVKEKRIVQRDHLSMSVKFLKKFTNSVE